MALAHREKRRMLIQSTDSDTGEHIENDKHELQYIPFPICNETGKPLELQYGVEDGTTSPHLSNLKY